jgi:ABC-type amino acid transport substrate-binding protein
MKRRSAFLTFAACALMSAHPAKAAAVKSPAAESPKIQQAVDFSKVRMVTLNEGKSVAFFDNATGMIYIYDPALTKCIAIKKLNTLGEPAQDITS